MAQDRRAVDPLATPEHAGHGPGRAVTRLNRQVELAIQPTGLSVPQYRLLCLVADGMYGSSDAASKLSVSPASVTEVVDGLVSRGWVVRGVDPADRRRSPLQLTKAGKAMLGKAQKAVTARLRAIAAYLDDSSEVRDPLLVLELWHDALERYWAAEA